MSRLAGTNVAREGKHRDETPPPPPPPPPPSPPARHYTFDDTLRVFSMYQHVFKKQGGGGAQVWVHRRGINTNGEFAIFFSVVSICVLFVADLTTTAVQDDDYHSQKCYIKFSLPHISSKLMCC